MSRQTLSELELDDRLHRANPVSRAALDDDGVRAALASVRRSMESGARRNSALPSTVRSGNRRRWAPLGVATAAVAVASLVGVETLTGGAGSAGLPLAVSPAAAAQLDRVAHAAAAAAAPGAGQLEYIATRIESTVNTSFENAPIAFEYDQTMQEWDGQMPSGMERQRMTSDGISFATPQDRANYLADSSAFNAAFDLAFGTSGPNVTGLVADVVFPPHKSPELPPSASAVTDQVLMEAERPSSPQALLADLAHAFPGEQPSDTWGQLVTILRTSTNPQLRATAYQALSYVAGTTVLGNQTDQLGRAGVAIRFPEYAGGPIETLIVSPTTGWLLEDETTSKASIGTGTMVEHDVYLQHAIVNSVTALPGGGTQPLTPATQTEDPATGDVTTTPQTTTSGSPTTTSTSQTTTSESPTTTSTSQTTTSGSPTTTAPSQTGTSTSQTTTSSPQS